MAKIEKITVSKGQNIIDVCIQELGSVEGLIHLLRENNLTPNSDLVPGNEMLIPVEEVVDAPTRSFFRSLKYKVNTGIVPDTSFGSLLLEDGTDLLLEDGTQILLETL